MKPLRPRTLIARKLRRDATDVERILWRAIRQSGWDSKFRRQHPIDKRVADFACPKRKLAMELDGGQHDGNRTADAKRTRELGIHGYRVIRFWNNDILDNLEGVLDTIGRELAAPTSPRPSPPPRAERE